MVEGKDGKALEMEQLKKKLTESGVDLSRFGKGAAKSLDELLSELHSGKSLITTDGFGKITRNVAVASLMLLRSEREANGSSTAYVLVETKVQFADGRMPCRWRCLEVISASR